MPTSARDHLQHNVETALEDVARSLHQAAQDAEGLSHDASEALSKAASDVKRAADSLRQHSAATARSALQKAVHEIHEHPVASLAAAITAAAALVNMILAARDKEGPGV